MCFTVTNATKRFGAKLEDVFPKSFPCASHPPATFCKFHKQVLVLVTAFVHASIRHIISFGNEDCQVLSTKISTREMLRKC